jgi:hypothetical protein
MWIKFKAFIHYLTSGPAFYALLGVVIAAVFLALLFAVIAIQTAETTKAEVHDLRKEISIRTQSQEEIRNEVNRTKTQVCSYVLSHEKTLEIPTALKADCFPVVRTTDYEDQINPNDARDSPRVDAPTPTED